MVPEDNSASSSPVVLGLRELKVFLLFICMNDVTSVQHVLAVIITANDNDSFQQRDSDGRVATQQRVGEFFDQLKRLDMV